MRFAQPARPCTVTTRTYMVVQMTWIAANLPGLRANRVGADNVVPEHGRETFNRYRPLNALMWWCGDGNGDAAAPHYILHTHATAVCFMCTHSRGLITHTRERTRTRCRKTWIYAYIVSLSHPIAPVRPFEAAACEFTLFFVCCCCCGRPPPPPPNPSAPRDKELINIFLMRIYRPMPILSTACAERAEHQCVYGRRSIHVGFVVLLLVSPPTYIACDEPFKCCAVFGVGRN